MNIRLALARKEEQSVGTWAGGTTTQLAIWPPESDYIRRDFLWRISTAHVDLEESVFTSMPGFRRLLMVLEGKVQLNHQGRREVDLGAFGQDEFDGGWTTTSRGRCVDFNLMMAAECKGRLTALQSVQGRTVFDPFVPMEEKAFSQITEAVYCLRPGVCVRVQEGKERDFEVVLGQGDFLLLQLSASREEREKNWGEPIRAFFQNIDGDRPWGVRATIQVEI
jgi:hypothetical protein